jgi:hypothetical protein
VGEMMVSSGTRVVSGVSVEAGVQEARNMQKNKMALFIDPSGRS